jgi:hypothetical protein
MIRRSPLVSRLVLAGWQITKRGLRAGLGWGLGRVRSLPYDLPEVITSVKWGPYCFAPGWFVWADPT